VNDRDAKREANNEEQLTTADLAGARRKEDELGGPVPRVDAERVRLEGKPLRVVTSGDNSLSDVRAGGSGVTPSDAQNAPASESGTNMETGQHISSGVAASVAAAPSATAGSTSANRGASSGAAAAAAPARDLETGPLFSSDEAKTFRTQWDAIQVGFVDEPRQSVEQADSLVAAAMKRLAEQFSEERSRLEKQWDRGAYVSTEDLRLALRRYRSFFGRLLSV